MQQYIHTHKRQAHLRNCKTSVATASTCFVWYLKNQITHKLQTSADAEKEGNESFWYIRIGQI